MSYLFQPFQTGRLTLANRLVLPPMATAKADQDGHITQELLDYYDGKSRGGLIGLIIIEHSYIDALGKASKIQLSVADDNCIPGLRSLADTIHRNGCKAAMQINHAGCSTTAEVIGAEPAGPSAIPHPKNGRIPRELTLGQIDCLVEAFAEAARRTKEAGFDAVEIHSAHGYLLNQFYSPLTNQRKDEYGGSVEKRIKLHIRVIEAVRATVGQDFPIIMRLGAVDYMTGGSTTEDSIAAARAFERAGLDILDISGGFSGYEIPGVTGQGIFSPVTEAIKAAVSTPVILTGGITYANAADELLRDKKADLIGVGRAILKDSNWAQRAKDSLD